MKTDSSGDSVTPAPEPQPAAKPIAMARPRFSEAAVTRVAEAIRLGAIASGPIVRELESRLATVLPVPHVAACANGTAALHAALSALGVGPGSCVITTALSFVASASAVVHAGATPVFCDVDESFNLDPEHLDRMIRRQQTAGRPPAAVIFVHLYGNPTNAQAVASVCERHGVPLVEDCAQAYGAALPGRPVASFGAIATFSFYATKTVAGGEGGAVVSSDPALIAHVRKFINHGRVSAYEHEFVGYNYRMTDLHAALTLDQLDHFDAHQVVRAWNAAAFLTAFAGLPLGFPRLEGGATHAYHQFTLTMAPDHRSGLIEQLTRDGVQTAIIYPTPLPRLLCFRDGPGAGTAFPAAERASRGCLSIPVHADLAPNDIRRIVASVTRFFA